MPTRYSIFLLLVFATSHVFAQITFNKRQIFGFEAAVLTSIVPADSCYYATGIIADTIYPYRTGSIFVKYNESGEVLFYKTIKDTLKTWETWEHTLSILPDGNFVTTGYTFDPLMKGLLLKYNSNGDTLFTEKFLNSNCPQCNFISPKGFMPYLNNGFVFVFWIDTTPVGIFQNTSILVSKTDSTGNIEWSKNFGDNNWDRPYTALIDPQNNILFGGVKTNLNLVDENYTYQTRITSLDSLGNENWTYLSPISEGLRDAANDMVLLDDGSLIVASGIGHEIDVASVNKVYFDKYVFKLAPDHQIEWELTFPDEILTSSSRTSNVEKVSDGSGFVFGGVASMSLPAPALGANMGWIAKVSNTGTLMWERKYLYLTDTPSDNKIYDLKETPDGGFILCGEARDIGDGATFPQQAWLLKLDGYGCLVPGCHLLDSTGERESPAIELAIYPNPASDYLNFQVRASSISKQSAIYIINMEGQVLQTFDNVKKDVTYIVSAWDWPSGIYVLQYLEGGLVRASERFVVAK